MPRASSADKFRGGVYSDPGLVELLLELTGWNGRGSLLEPSLGDGAFLRQAWARAKPAGGAVAGVELDPQALAAARGGLGADLDDPRLELVEGDALDPEASGPAGRRGQYDVVLGNPPWVRGERVPAERRAVYRQRYGDSIGSGGNVDLGAYFVRRAFDWLKPGGRLGFVLSQGLLEAASTALLREFLGRHTLIAVVTLEWAADLFPGANVIPCLLVVEKRAPPPGHTLRVGTCRPGPFARERIEWSAHEQGAWLALGRGGRWPLGVTAVDVPLLEALGQHPRPLRASYGLAIRTRGRATQLIGDAEAAQGFVDPRPLIDGREVRPWAVEHGGRFLDYRPEQLSDPKSPEFFRAPKLLVPRIALGLTAAVDDGQGQHGSFFARNTVMVVRAPGSLWDAAPQALAALLNSLPLRYYAALLLRAGTLAGSHRSTFYVRILDDLPLPSLSGAGGEADLEQLNRLARAAGAAARTRDAAALREVEAEVDAVACRLYGLTAAQVETLRSRAADPTLAPLLNPPSAGQPVRRIGVQDYAPGRRYAAPNS